MVHGRKLYCLIANTRLPVGIHNIAFALEPWYSFYLRYVQFIGKLGFIYIELDKFVKEETELETELDKWLHVLKNMKWMTDIPASLSTPIFEKLFSVGEYHNLTKEEKDMYDNSLKVKWDNESVLESALDYAISTTKTKNTQDIARNFKNIGVPIEDIAKATGLSIEEIEKL